MQSALFALKDAPTDLSRMEIVQKAAFANTRILRCLRGGLFAVVSHWNQLACGRWSDLVKQDWDSIIFPASPQAVEEDQKIHALEHMWQRPDRRYEYHFGELRRALQDLRECYALCSQLETVQNMSEDEKSFSFLKRVMTWIFRISQEFMQLLDQQSPDAWVILAHYANLLARVKNVWWLVDLPPNIVSTTALVLDEAHWGLIAWPAQGCGSGPWSSK